MTKSKHTHASRLIAAAPDLLEALTEIAGFYNSAQNSEQDFAGNQDEMIDIARSAIAKMRDK